MNKPLNFNYRLEYNFCNLPMDFPIIPLLGDTWVSLESNITFLHFHNCLEIGYCYAGNGVIAIENRLCDFTEGDISILCPNTTHITKSNVGFMSTWEYLYIDPNRLLEDFFPNGFPNADLLMYGSEDFKNILKGDEYPKIKSLVLSMLDEMRYKKENYQSSMRGLCLALVIELTRINPRTSSNEVLSHSESRLTIAPALEYVDKQYMHKIRIDELANTCHLSPTHFRRLFNSIMRTNPLDYLNHIRIRKSCTLLYTTELSILNISLQVGFPTVSSYNRHFSAIMGISPLKWRNNRRAIPLKDLTYSVCDV